MSASTPPVRWALALALALALAAGALAGSACRSDEPEDLSRPCPSTGRCGTPFSLLTLRRPDGPDFDNATWTFTVTLPGGAVLSTCSLSATAVSCSDRKTTDGTAPLNVTADITPAGLGRAFRIDTFGEPRATIRVERNGVLVEELDYAPNLTRTGCEKFSFDFGGTHDLPAAP